jgi:serine protease Do
MKKIKRLIIAFYLINFAFLANADQAPNSFADLAEELMPSVVFISTTTTKIVNQMDPSFPFKFPPGSPFEDMFKDYGKPKEKKGGALGSGFIIDEDGTVITNNHVIDGADTISIRVNGDKEYKAKLIGKDPLMDIAVLKIISKDKFKPVNFGDSDKARIGDWVIAIGNPFGLGGTVTSGIISARNRNIGLSRYEDFIQTDASINVGNSGGPLFNMSGKVIGINSAILGQSGSIGIGFSIPSNSAKKVVEQLIKFGETKRGWLGVRIQIVTKEIADIEKLDEPRGALVASVASNSPSDKGGIKSGDIILEFNGVKIKEMKELPKIVAQTEVGKTVDVKVWRNNKEIIKKIKLGRLETSEDFNDENKKTETIKELEINEIKSLKISTRVLNKKDIADRKLPNQTTGLVITDIKTDSPINYLNVNNIIIEAQKKKIKSTQDLESIIDVALKSSEKTILIVIYNNQNQRRYIGVKLD